MIKAAKLICPSETQNFESIKLSRRTVGRRIETFGDHIKNTIKTKIKDFVAYSLALDETTDLVDTSQLVLFIRGVDNTLSPQEYLLDLVPLKSRTTGEVIFEAVCSVLETNEVSLMKLVSVATDGAPALCGEKLGFVGRLKSHLKNIGKPEELQAYHCIIHQEALSAKIINLQHVMDVVTKTINKIKSKALMHRQFRQLLRDIDENYEDLVYYTEVRWLSRGKMLKRFFDLRILFQWPIT